MSMDSNHFDLLVIGGGINGVGVTNDAAGRGLSVALCEREDLASETSSYSSKLIHGGLRYLENFEFGLVKASLSEREILLKKAPFMIKPMQFVMPHNKKMRSIPVIRLGLWMYDHLGSRHILPGSGYQSGALEQHRMLKDDYQKSFTYYDCTVDDARLVVLNALQAKSYGARIFLKTSFLKAIPEGKYWACTLQEKNHKEKIIYAKAIVNASGRSVADLNHQSQLMSQFQVSLIKGTHIVLPNLYTGDYSYILQHDDGRVIFVIPYHKEFTLIGTTDVEYDPRQGKPEPSEAEIIYLCEAVSRYFKKSIGPHDVISAYAGVRTLLTEPGKAASKLSRDSHVEHLQKEGLPWITLWGGKVTTYRTLAEKCLKTLVRYFPYMKEPWTSNIALPGGDIAHQDMENYINELKKAYVWLDGSIIERMFLQYGRRIESLLADTDQLSDLGEHIGSGLFEREVEFLKNTEWACSSGDVLWRRTKLGLNFNQEQLKKLNGYLS